MGTTIGKTKFSFRFHITQTFFVHDLYDKNFAVKKILSIFPFC